MPFDVAASITPINHALSAPLSVLFAVVPRDGIAPYTYHWTFGDGNESSAPSGTHEYLTGRPYAITLTVTDAECDIVNWSTSYEMFPALTASFTAAVTLDPDGANSVAFASVVDNGTGPYVYAWDLGDGATSTLANLTHTYSEAGSYTVILVVTDAEDHTLQLTQLVEISIPLSVAVTATPVLGIDPTTVDFVAVASNGRAPYVYTWDFGDGATASGATVSHAFSVPGQYTVKVRVVDDLEHDTGTTVPVVAIQALKVNPLCIPARGAAPFPVTFYAQATGGKAPYTYQWDFQDGTQSTRKDPVHTFVFPGHYNVTLVITDSEGRVFSAVRAIQAQEI